MTKAQNSWQDTAGQRWAELSERTDAQLGPLGRQAMALLAPARGERVLDIGCGAGQSTAELAELVGETGQVVGIDISEPLLKAAKSRLAGRGATTARFRSPGRCGSSVLHLRLRPSCICG